MTEIVWCSACLKIIKNKVTDLTVPREAIYFYRMVRPNVPSQALCQVHNFSPWATGVLKISKEEFKVSQVVEE